MEIQQEIIFAEIDGVDGNIGLITLNRPQVLNALNHSMFIAMDKQLSTWEEDTKIKAVIVRAAPGRAFSAGGDLRAVYELAKKNEPVINYFGEEYRLNSRIYHFSKPYIALLDGFTMGGGAGISIHGSYRIATDRLVFAMPETTIGFFPDIGATYFLSRLPHRIGFYLGLTGARIPYNDCLAVGLVDQVVARDSLDDIIQKIAATSLARNTDATLAELVKHFSIPVEKSALLLRQAEIETCFSKNKMEDILQALERYPNAWCGAVANELLLKSPTSLKVTLRLLLEATKLTFENCQKMEYKAATHFVRGHDFYEGVRALIIDKDQKPVWKPAKLAQVSYEDVEKYFE